MTEQQLRRYGRSFILAIVLFLAGGHLFAVERAGASESGSFRLFALKHISAEQSKRYLSEAKLGTASQMPGSNTILVTAGPGELSKAMAVLNFVDAEEEFVIVEIFTASGAGNLPSSEQLAAQIGNISVGSFSNPPTGGAGAKAIVDIHNGAVVVVAPVSRLEKIVSAVEQAGTVKQPAAVSEVQTVEKDTETVKQPKIVEQPGTAKQVRKTGERGPPKAADAVEEKPIAPVRERKVPKVSSPAAADSLYTPGPLENGEQVLKMQLPEKLQIIDLLGLAGEYLHLNFMYDPVKVKGDVTLKLFGKTRGDMKVKDLYPLLESALKFRGFAMTRKGNLVVVVPTAEASDIDPALLEPGKGEVESGDVIVARIFTLEHIDPASATTLLTAMKLGITPPQVAGANKLIVTGYAYRMERVEQLLKMIDLPGEPRQFRFRQLKFTMAQTLAPKLKTLSEQLGTVSITVATGPSSSGTSTARRPGESTTAYTARLTRDRAAAAVRARSSSQAGAGQATAVYLDADERTNRIMMIGLEEQLAVVEGLIDALDVEQQDLRTLQVYKIEHVGAEEVLKKLQEMNIIGGTSGGYSSSGRSRITGTTAVTGTSSAGRTSAAPTSSRTSSAGAATDALVEEPQVVIIEPTNSLLVNATAEQHARIATIIGHVDSETEEGVMPYVIYPLENQTPEDLEAVLTKLIQETITNKEGKIEKVVKKTEDEIFIVPDENTFSLIVYASKKNHEWIANLIKTLDKRRPQVLIDVTLVEVWETDNFDLDLNLIQSFPDLIQTAGQTGSFAASETATVIDKLLEPGMRDRFIDFSTGGGNLTGFYGDLHINALLTAVQTKNYGRILAKPKILVNDNEQGTIGTTDTIYVKKESSTPISSTSGTAGQPYSTFTTSTSYDGYDAGILLDITPHISSGDLLRLEMTMTRKDFRETKDESKPPDTTQSDITTVVTVPDGSTIILGGLVKLNQSKGGSKVPILGDLPILGGLFRQVGNRDKQNKLYIFVRAEILRPDETLAGLPDLEKISGRNRVAFELFEEKFQKYEDWPGIKPKPMAPLRVLDVE